MNAGEITYICIGSIGAICVFALVAYCITRYLHTRDVLSMKRIKTLTDDDVDGITETIEAKKNTISKGNKDDSVNSSLDDINSLYLDDHHTTEANEDFFPIRPISRSSSVSNTHSQSPTKLPATDVDLILRHSRVTNVLCVFISTVRNMPAVKYGGPALVQFHMSLVRNPSSKYTATTVDLMSKFETTRNVSVSKFVSLESNNFPIRVQFNSMITPAVLETLKLHIKVVGRSSRLTNRMSYLGCVQVVLGEVDFSINGGSTVTKLLMPHGRPCSSIANLTA